MTTTRRASACTAPAAPVSTVGLSLPAPALPDISQNPREKSDHHSLTEVDRCRQSALSADLRATGRRRHGCEIRKRPHDWPMNNSTTSAPMPALFVGHGSPMNAIEDNAF